MSQQTSPSTAESELPPVVEDLSVYVIGGRRKSSEPVLQEAEDAEHLGFSRVWISERLNVKEAGVILGAAGARTSRIGLGTGAICATSRFPVVIASMGATLTSVFGPRFTLGLGRGHDAAYPGHGFGLASYAATIDYADIIRRLWKGETISYKGPAGTYEGLVMVDVPEGPPPEIWFAHCGGPKASAVAANTVFDGAILVDMMNLHATKNSVDWTRAECERIGRDPESVRICQCVVTAPEMDDYETRRLVHARAVGILDYDEMGETFVKNNGWDPEVMHQVRNHPKFQTGDLNADQSFHLEDVMDVTHLIPDSWMREAAAIGSVSEVVAALQAFKDAGADEIAVYGSTPADNTEVMAAWRARSSGTGNGEGGSR